MSSGTVYGYTNRIRDYINTFRAGKTLWWKNELETFRTPTLREVNVTIGDTDRFTIYDSYCTRELAESIMQARQCWTMEERAGWARLLRAKLLGTGDSQ